MKKLLLLIFITFSGITSAQTGTYTGTGSVTQGAGTVTTANLKIGRAHV